MSKSGIRYPENLDLISTKDNDCFLHIVQVDRVDDEDLPKFQDKINNYLSFALDGQMLRMYPAMLGKRVTIRVELSCDPTPVQKEFYSAITKVCESDNIGFQVEVPEYLRKLEQEFPTQPGSRKTP